MKILPYNLISPNFRAYHECDVEKLNDKGNNKKNFLVHQSGMFRYENEYGSDEKVIKYLQKQKQKQNEPFEIVSAGCSYGEEAYSYALALDGFGIKSHISAFDLSKIAIQNAQKGSYVLTEAESRYLFDGKTSDFKDNIKASLNKNFNIKRGGCSVIHKKDHAFENCNFFVGDITKTSDYFDKNSKDVILCRYVLYHLPLMPCGKTIGQFYNTLKPGGLLVFAPSEYGIYEDMAKNAGFKTSKIADYIFQKPYSVDSELILSLLNPLES